MLLVQRLLALGAPAADGGLVHDVVVVQRRQVGQLADDGRRGSTSGARGSPNCAASRASIGRNRLPPGGHQVPGGLADERVLAADGGDQRRLDAGQARRRATRPSAPSGSQGPIVDAGVEIRCQTSAGEVPLDCGTGSGHQPTKIAACSARSSTDPGTMPSARVAVAVTARTIVVGSPGTPTVGPSAAGRREVHQHDDPQVGERQHRAGQHGDQDQRPGARLDGRPEHRELPGEARWSAGSRRARAGRA